MDDHADSGDEVANGVHLPGARRGDDGSRSSKVEVLTLQVRFSSTGREWAAISMEGLHVYSLDEDMVFDPMDLTEEMTPAAVKAHLSGCDYGRALQLSLHLNESELIEQVLDNTPYASIPSVVQSLSVPALQLERLLQLLATLLDESPHLEFYLQWTLELLQKHGSSLNRNRGTYLRAFRALYKAVASKQKDLQTLCRENHYTLTVLEDQVQLSMGMDTTESP